MHLFQKRVVGLAAGEVLVFGFDVLEMGGEGAFVLLEVGFESGVRGAVDEVLRGVDHRVHHPDQAVEFGFHFAEQF